MIEIYLLEQLSAFAKYGTLSKAAEHLHISQPALSRSMKKLEEDLGVTLFVRESKKLLLNETGKLAAQLAQSQVNQNKELVNRIKAFDKSLHSIRVGSCAPLPITRLMPLLQEKFGGMTISTELVYGEKLLSGIKDGEYQLGVLHKPTDDSELFCQRYISEALYISVPENHRLARKESVRFSDLDGEKFLLLQNLGFWHIVHEKMMNTDFLIQVDMDALTELVERTDYPAFSSDQILQAGRVPQGRIHIPIDEDAARCTYYIACRNSDKTKYASFFNSVRSAVIGG